MPPYREIMSPQKQHKAVIVGCNVVLYFMDNFNEEWCVEVAVTKDSYEHALAFANKAIFPV